MADETPLTSEQEDEAVAVDISLTHLKKLAIFTAAVFLIISATLVTNQNLYYMAALLLVLPAVSYLIGMLSVRGLEVSRQMPVSAWEGETGRFILQVSSSARVPRLFLQVDDNLPRWLKAEGGRIRRFTVPVGETVQVECPILFEKRGHYHLQTLKITALDPLGLVAFTKEFEAPIDLIVYPVPQPLPSALMAGGDRFGFRDVPTNAVRGSGVDPDGVREYVPGDPLRRMHWKSTARTGRLSVIEFEEPRAVNLCIALDLKRGTDLGEGKKTTLEYLVKLAASLVETSIRHGAAVRLVLGSRQDVSGSGIDHLYGCLAALAGAEADDTLSIADVMQKWTVEGAAAHSVMVLTADPDLRTAAAMADTASQGSIVSLAYADPASFADIRLNSAPFLEAAAAAGAVLWTVKPDPDDQIHLEPIHYGTYASIA
jgi:uncharacterized protein (DUF58 family)